MTGPDYSDHGMFRGRLRRLVATIGLIAWIAGMGLPAFGGQHVADLRDAGATFLGVLHPVTQLEPVYPTLGDDHCAICHLQRAANGAALSATGSLVAVSSALSDLAVDQHAYVSLSLIATAPRGPPLDSTSTFV